VSFVRVVERFVLWDRLMCFGHATHLPVSMCECDPDARPEPIQV